MPLPTPKSEEQKSDFISRCMNLQMLHKGLRFAIHSGTKKTKKQRIVQHLIQTKNNNNE